MRKAKMLTRKMFRAKRGQEGQGMTEYIIIVVLIAIALIAAVGLFGNTLKNLFNKSEKKLKKNVESEI